MGILIAVSYKNRYNDRNRQKQIRSRKSVVSHSRNREANVMLDLVKQETERIDFRMPRQIKIFFSETRNASL